MAIAVQLQRSMGGKYLMQGHVLVAATGLTANEWFPVDGQYPFTVHVIGINGDTVRLHVSNAPTKPADATVGVSPLADLTADGLWHISYPVRWAKVSVTVNGAGTMNAYLLGFSG